MMTGRLPAADYAATPVRQCNDILFSILMLPHTLKGVRTGRHRANASPLLPLCVGAMRAGVISTWYVSGGSLATTPTTTTGGGLPDLLYYLRLRRLPALPVARLGHSLHCLHACAATPQHAPPGGHRLATARQPFMALRLWAADAQDVMEKASCAVNKQGIGRW